eukprot:jgi/Hompol1/614/HPOL_001259-RA
MAHTQPVDADVLLKDQLKWFGGMIRNMKKRKDAIIFLNPVDPVLLNIPTYFTVIKHPMDISTIEKKLTIRAYKSIADIKADFNTMFNNCYTFNGPEAAVSNMARSLQRWYTKELEKLPLTPRPPQDRRKKSLVSLGFDFVLEEQDFLLLRSCPDGVSLTNVCPPMIFFFCSFSPCAFVRLSKQTREILGLDGRPKRESQPPSRENGTDSKKPIKKTSAEIKFCHSVHRELVNRKYIPANLPFLQPVDPIALGIPQYRTIITRPMDLSTIKKKLDANEYPNAAAFEADVRLMLNNCFTFNPPGSEVYNLGKRLEEIFVTKWAEKANFLYQHGEGAPRPPKPKPTPPAPVVAAPSTSQPRPAPSAPQIISQPPVHVAPQLPPPAKVEQRPPVYAPVDDTDSSDDEDDDARHIQMLKTQIQLLQTQLQMFIEKRNKKRKRRGLSTTMPAAPVVSADHPVAAAPDQKPAPVPPVASYNATKTAPLTQTSPAAAAAAGATTPGASASTAPAKPKAPRPRPSGPPKERKRPAAKRPRSSSATPATASVAAAGSVVPQASATVVSDNEAPEITFEQKRELSEKIGYLPQDRLQTVFQIIQVSLCLILQICMAFVFSEKITGGCLLCACFCRQATGEEEIELDIDSLPKNVLWTLYKFVRENTADITSAVPVPETTQAAPPAARNGN